MDDVPAQASTAAVSGPARPGHGRSMHTDPHGTASPPTTSSAPEMAMVPTSVGRASREWDEQHVDLRAASAQVAEASTLLVMWSTVQTFLNSRP